MTEVRATIHNSKGIHVRPSGVIVNELSSIKSDIILESKGVRVPFLSIMDLLALGLQKGESLKICVSGPDEIDASERLVMLFEKDYDFPERD